MSTADQTHSARLHGEALLAARELADGPLIEQLMLALADVDDWARIEAAGILAGRWLNAPGTGQGRDLLVAGLLLVAGRFDGRQIAAAVQKGQQSPSG